MNGKTLKVVEYNLTFGTNDRMVNVFGLFRYKPNNNIYVIYADIDIRYNIIYYGSSHVKNNAILSMSCKDKQEEEIIKEYIFKVTAKENLDNFEIFSLEEIDGIEIIASNKLEVKSEVLYQLVEYTIPKKQVNVEEQKQEVSISTKKKTSKKIFLFLIIVIFLGGGYFFVMGLVSNDTTGKEIVCNKVYNHDRLDASVEEEIVYSFNYQEKLEKFNITRKYQFEEEEYQDFIKNGTFYRYMPDDDNDGGWDKNDNEYWFKVILKETVDSSYDNPTNYEEVFSNAKREGYTCDEKIIKE